MPDLIARFHSPSRRADASHPPDILLQIRLVFSKDFSHNEPKLDVSPDALSGRDGFELGT
jgi:hypothetical protein